MTSMKLLLTPKELADAIGASESSVRRWVDDGDIRMSRTAGGHRRIPLAVAIQFIRKMGATVIRPDILGLGDVRRDGTATAESSDEQRLFECLQAGDRILMRGLLVSWYLDGRSLPALFDGPVRNAFDRLGELWKHDEQGILTEHRATEICIEAIAMLRSALPPVDENAPLAMGGAPQGDPYQLPSLMAGSILAEAGFRDVNFGANTPVELLGKEAVARGARLIWLSISAHQESKTLRVAIRKLAGLLAKKRVDLVLGGRYASEVAPRDLKNVRQIGSMSELVEIAREIKSRRTHGQR